MAELVFSDLSFEKEKDRVKVSFLRMFYTYLEENSLEMEFYTLFPYTEESSEGSRHRWLFAARKFLHPLLEHKILLKILKVLI